MPPAFLAFVALVDAIGCVAFGFAIARVVDGTVTVPLAVFDAHVFTELLDPGPVDRITWHCRSTLIQLGIFRISSDEL